MTEFKKGLNRFGRLLMTISVVMILLIFFLNLTMHKNIFDSLMFAISLAVGITPQLLPAISSVNLSLGAKRMAQKDVIIRQLDVIDNIGGMDVLCSDKTGTITEGGVKIDAAFDLQENKSQELLKLVIDNAYYSSSNNNSIDQALLTLKDPHDMPGKKISQKAYNFTDRMSSVAVAYDDERFMGMRRLIITKGAIKNVIGICDRALDNNGQVVDINTRLDDINQIMEELGSQGYRALAIAVKEFDEEAEFNKGMIFVGFITFFDPLKHDSKEVIEKINELQVDFKIITGDSLNVAKFLATELGYDATEVISANELKNISLEQQGELVEKIKIFAEVEPEMKKSIIKLLKKQGHLVGYMGDGINDVPSLHEADVAISVDDAVDVAKEAANIVLLKSDLSVVLDGIVEGRRVFANTMKYIFIAVSANFGNMFSMAGASLLLKFLPLLPKQILMTNLLQDLPAMSLASDNADEGWITRPHRFNFKFIIKFMITFGLISSIFDYCMFAVLLHINANEQLFQTVWFTESVISAVMLMIVLRTTLPVVRSKPSKRLLLTSGFIIAFTAALSYLPFNHLLGFIPIPLFMWKYILGVIAIYMIVGELSKRLFYKYNRP